MKYFLRVSHLKRGDYLQIYQSEYIRGKGSRNKSYKAIGYVDDLRAKGVKDPVARAQSEVGRLNAELRKREAADRARKVGQSSPERHLGYFILRGIANSLPQFEDAVRAIASSRSFQYDAYDLMMALVYARSTHPASKRRTHGDILPHLFEDVGDDSYSQVLSCCQFIGSEYEKIASFLARDVRRVYGLDLSSSYFDCTNFYFEIDAEDGLRRKGPSKENRHDPIIGLGLLLDANQIPVALSMFPGNESEKPQLRSVLAKMRKENGIEGRTIQVADKGLNCARNIHEAILNGDGYLFSRSLKQMPKADKDWFFSLDSRTWPAVSEDDGNGGERVKYRYHCCTETVRYDYVDDLGRRVEFTAHEKWVITFSPKLHMKKTLELNRMVDKARGLCLSKAKKDEFGECAKYIRFRAPDGGNAVAELNEAAIEEERRFAGYNMLVTSEVAYSPRRIYGTYHNLWRIEQSFRMMKSYLDARPVFCSKEDSIKGHFLICYISLVLERILEFSVLGSRFCHEKIMRFIRDFSLVRLDSRNYVNLLTSRDEIGQFLESTILPVVTNYTISPADISMLLKVKLNKRIDEG